MFVIAAWAPSPESRQLAADVRAALRLADISETAAAIDMGMSLQQFYQQLDGKSQLSASRLVLLPLTFWKALIRVKASRLGLLVLDSDEVKDVLLEQAVRSAKRMARADMREERAERKVS